MNLVSGFTVGNESVSVPHLQFADDTILFCAASQVFVTNLRLVLLCFERISGLRVDMDKCKAAGLNLNEGDLDVYSRILCCEKEEWPIKYLGLPLGGNQKSVILWQPILEKMSKKLSG